MKKILIYIISLAILACALVLSYKYMQGRLNPKKPALPPSRLENCQDLKISDPKLIAFANKCLIKAGRRISDFAPKGIKRSTEAEKKKYGLETPDEWVVYYEHRGALKPMSDTPFVTISPITCECVVHEP